MDKNHSMRSAAYPALFHQEVIGLLRLQSSQDGPLPLLSSILQHMDYIGGVSHSFTELAQLDSAYLEAGFALEQLCAGGRCKCLALSGIIRWNICSQASTVSCPTTRSTPRSCWSCANMIERTTPTASKL